MKTEFLFGISALTFFIGLLLMVVYEILRIKNDKDYANWVSRTRQKKEGLEKQYSKFSKFFKGMPVTGTQKEALKFTRPSELVELVIMHIGRNLVRLSAIAILVIAFYHYGLSLTTALVLFFLAVLLPEIIILVISAIVMLLRIHVEPLFLAFINTKFGSFMYNKGIEWDMYYAMAVYKARDCIKKCLTKKTKKN